MKELIKAITELLKVKSLITLSIIGTLVFLAATGAIETGIFMTICSSIITFYFTKNNNTEKTDEKIDGKTDEKTDENK